MYEEGPPKSRAFKVEKMNRLEKPGTEQIKIHKHNNKGQNMIQNDN